MPEKIWEESIVEGCCTLFALPGLHEHSMAIFASYMADDSS